MKTIILVRHGQSREQSGESLDGINPPLSSLGIRQSLRLKERLAGERFDIALVSPLDRAYETYRIAEPSVGDAAFDSRLIEVDFLENWYSHMAGYVPAADLPVRNATGWLAPVEARTQELVHELLRIKHERILLFAHQGIFKQLIGAWLGLPGDAFMYGVILGNTSLTGLTLSDDGTRSIHFLNDVHHLQECEGGLQSGMSVHLDQRRPWRAERRLAAMGVEA